jgi:hypothetical protein
MRLHAPLVVVILALGMASVAQGRDPVLDVFRAQLEVDKRLLAQDLGALERLQTLLRGAADRLVRLGDDLLRAERDGEDYGSYSARTADLLRAEYEVAELVAAAQHLRTTLGGRRAVIDQMQAEIRRLEESVQPGSDEISGRWAIAIEPGGTKGTIDLRLDGSIVSGVYQLSGDWKGSLRGTWVGNLLRLERIDTQLGFIAVYNGRLVLHGNDRRLEGSWESTNLAAGMPESGTWLARRESRP